MENKSNINENNFKVTINSKHSLFDLHLKETWKYRDLVFMFVKKDFISKYKQTILGPLWAIIQPLLTTVVFTLIFGNLAGLPTSDVEGLIIPSFLFYMAGNICWGYFSSTVSLTSRTFISNAHIMGKVYYPRIVSPLSESLSGLISFVIQFAMFIVFWLYYYFAGGTDIVFSWNLLLIPVILLELIMVSMGTGIIISALTTKYRDLAMLVAFGLQLLQYASPIAYGLTLATEKLSAPLMAVYMLVPMTPIVTTFRYALFGVGYFNLTYFMAGIGISVLVLFIGLLLFNKIERTFMDTI